MFVRMLRLEIRKIQWPLVGALLVLGPVMALGFGTTTGGPAGMDPWLKAFSFGALRYAWLFYPLLAGVFAALLCRVEHSHGGWKQMLSLPVPRVTVYAAKMTVLAGLLAACNLVFGAAVLASGWATHITAAIPWATIGRALFSGWLAVLPLAALQLWVSSRWKSFGAALALNVCFTLPSIFAAQSHDIGPWYPWAQPVLGMVPMFFQGTTSAVVTMPPASLWLVVLGGFLVATIGGLVTFARADFSD